MILVPLPLPPCPVYRLGAFFKLADLLTAICTLIKGTTQAGKRGSSALTTDALSTQTQGPQLPTSELTAGCSSHPRGRRLSGGSAQHPVQGQGKVA